MKQTLSKLLLLAVLATGVQSAQADNITVNGTSRSYNVIVPKNLGENRPLLIFCHGYNQDAGWMQNSEFKNDNVSMEAVCDTAKFVCVFPNGIDRAWDVGGDRDINFIKAIIEKMVTDHKIDRNRIYLGGFSMGGMLTYNAINKMHNIIAAFVSCSGPSVVTPSSSTRPIPLLHIQGTADNFGGVQPALNPWIKHNGCPTTDKVVSNYNGFSGAKMHTWGPGNNGVEVKLLELADKGHWICKEPQVYTGKEIWNFCKKYSLELKNPQVRITSPQSSLRFVTLGGHSSEASVKMTATASDPDGQVTKLEFYDGSKLVDSTDKTSSTITIEGLTVGTHQLRAVATDDEGRTGEAMVTVTVEEPTGNYIYSKVFENFEGGVPAGWMTYDGDEKRVGDCNGFSQGSRVFHLTGDPHAFEWGLYTRNKEGRANAGYARYASKESTTTLTLLPGNYQLTHRLANWNCADFSPVRIAVETIAGVTVHEETVTPTSNIGNSASNAFSGVTTDNFRFDVNEAGRYQVTFYTADAPWADLVIGPTALKYMGAVSAITDATREAPASSRYYDLQGRPVEHPVKGLYIMDGKKVIK